MKLPTTQKTKWYKQFDSTRLEIPADIFYKIRGYLTQTKRIVDRNQNAQQIEIMKIEFYVNHLKLSN